MPEKYEPPAPEKGKPVEKTSLEQEQEKEPQDPFAPGQVEPDPKEKEGVLLEDKPEVPEVTAPPGADAPPVPSGVDERSYEEKIADAEKQTKEDEEAAQKKREENAKRRDEVLKECRRILREHGNMESNIPTSHPTYWALMGEFRALSAQV